ncbi:MAG: response regulator [Alphaproteobacteria bacterium]|nr:response regulator [Alphaproteobacteria bacterium]
MGSLTPANAANAKTALLVWGSGGERRKLADMLASLGFQDVQIVESAVEAFARLAVSQPDIVFVEARIKPVPGLVIIRELRATPLASRDAPMALWTNADAEALRAEASAAGVDALLEGAFERADVLALLDHVARHGRDPAARGRAFGPERRTPHAQTGEMAAPRGNAQDAALDRIEKLAAAAKCCVAAWSRNGLEAELAHAMGSLDEAALLAMRCGDSDLLKCLNKALRTIDDIRRTWDADDRTVLEAIDAALAYVGTRASAVHAASL